MQFKNSIVREVEPESLIERAISSMGRFLGLVYRIGANEKFLWCLFILILIGVLLSGIFLSPFGGFHVEGLDLQPAKNLARHGIYGTLTTRGFDDLTYRSSAGPGIILPNALIFKLFGINVYNSRALYAAFVVMTSIVFYYVARDLYGKKVALLALLLLAFSPGLLLTGIMEYGGIMGSDAYTPALLYLLIGALFWFKSIDANKKIYLLISGLFWGLSFQTKWLFLFAIFAVILTCIILRLSNHGLGSKYYLIPSSMVFLVTVAWFIFRIFNVGLRQELNQLGQFWAEHGHRAVGGSTEEGITAPIFAIARPIAGLAQADLWGNQLFLIILAVLYIIILIWKGKMADYKSLFFISFILIWFTWWLLFNFDLAQLHLIMVIDISQLFIAKLLFDSWEYSSLYKDRFLDLVKNKESQKAIMFYLLRVAIVVIVLAKVLLPPLRGAGTLYNRNLTLTKPYKEMRTYIKNNTEKNAIFAGWGWSMPWGIDLDEAGDHIIKDRSTYSMEQREAVPEYFIVSPEWPLLKVTKEWPSVVTESSWSIKQNEVRKKFLEQNASLIRTFGGDKHKWLLYKVNNDISAQLP
jgi:Dolichyl-phosphate-mannose-protein mannosyltransferase